MPIGDKRPRALSSDEGMSQSHVPRPAPENNDSRRSGNRVESSFNTSSISGDATVQNAGGNIFNVVTKDELDRRIALDTNARMKETQHGLNKKEVLEWIYSAESDTSSNYNAAQKVHLAGTGSWFLDGPEFSQWKAQPGSVLWLEGGRTSPDIITVIIISSSLYLTAGSGKTILSSSVIKEIIDFCELKHSARGYAYFFFDARSGKLQDLAHEKFIQSLISQLADRCGDDIPTALVSLYNACDKGHRRPDHNSLENTLLGVLECFRDVYIVIDSLDECAAKEDLLKWIQSVTSKTSRTPHLLVTSRSVWEIQQGLASLSRLLRVSIGDKSSESDIRAYVDAELARTVKWKTPGDKEVIEAALFHHSGTFRFVALQLHDVMKCRNKTQLKKQLSSLPKDLNALYDGIFERSDDPEELQKFLQWLAFSKRDLTRSEIDEVATVDLGGTDGPLYDLDRRSEEPGAILTIGYGLVTEINGTVKLAHFSVKEYLIRRLRSIAERQGCTSEELSHSVIAQTCLAHLLYFSRESILDGEPPGYISEDHLSSFPLARYAGSHWVYHFHHANADDPQLLKLLLKLFALPRSRAMINWIRLHDPHAPSWDEDRWQAVDGIASPLYYACLAGLTQVVEQLISNGAHVNVGGPYGTALNAASAGGHVALAKLLLDNGADVNVPGGECGTAIQTASAKGHVELAKLLLDNGADVNVTGNFYTALQVACQRGHIEFAKLLLDNGADVNIAGSCYGTALIVASAGGHIELAKLLLDNGADVNITAGIYGTALKAASGKGHVELVKLLRDRSVIDPQGY